VKRNSQQGGRRRRPGAEVPADHLPASNELAERAGCPPCRPCWPVDLQRSVAHRLALLCLVCVSVACQSSAAHKPETLGPGSTSKSVQLKRLDTDPIAVFAERSRHDFSILARAETTLLSYCLSSNGYPPQQLPLIAPDEGVDDGRLTLEIAEQYGYGLPPDEEGGGDVSLVGNPPVEVLWGSGAGGQPIGGVPADGCYGYARRVLYQGKYDDYEAARSQVERIRNDAVLAARAHPDVLAATRRWSDCFTDKGYHYDTPSAAFHAGILLATADQIPMAVADVQCRQASDLEYLREQALWNFELIAVEEQPDGFAAFSSRWSAALDTAEHILSGEPLPSLAS